MRLDTACRDVFARHETFHPRFGWFRKAFVAAATDPVIFNDDDATVRLGVGKNMVRSMRFWGTAAHLLVDEAAEGTRHRQTKPSNVATAILQPHGLDPYMENPATWWWLHWLLTGPDCHLPVWWIILHELPIVEFDDDLLVKACHQAIETSTWTAPHASSISKDVSAFLRTYGGPASIKVKFDDQFGCPLRDLNLLSTSALGGYRLATEPPPTLPGAIVLLALLDYASIALGEGAHSFILSRAANDPGGPGRAFRLTDIGMEDLITPIVNQTDGVSISSQLGAPQLVWDRDLTEVARTVVTEFYGFSERDPLPPLIGMAARAPFREYELLRLWVAADAQSSLVS